MWELIVRPDAELDLQEAFQWYKKSVVGSAVLFFQKLKLH
jgi:hypothetical protein